MAQKKLHLQILKTDPGFLILRVHSTSSLDFHFVCPQVQPDKHAARDMSAHR
jgi:hypothetical protein